jgi:hypothetical protein
LAHWEETGVIKRAESPLELDERGARRTLSQELATANVDAGQTRKKIIASCHVAPAAEARAPRAKVGNPSSGVLDRVHGSLRRVSRQTKHGVDVT